VDKMLGMYNQYVNLIKTIPLVIALVGLVMIGAQYAHATTDLGGIGYAEGYSHMPMSHPNDKNYVEHYNMGVRDYNDGLVDHNLTYLGKVLPTYKNDNYKRFLAGEDAGDNSYNAQQGHDKDLNETCPARHTEEYCTGYHFGLGMDENFDAS
jgi:hypothetical protein